MVVAGEGQVDVETVAVGPVSMMNIPMSRRPKDCPNVVAVREPMQGDVVDVLSLTLSCEFISEITSNTSSGCKMS